MIIVLLFLRCIILGVFFIIIVLIVGVELLMRSGLDDVVEIICVLFIVWIVMYIILLDERGFERE